MLGERFSVPVYFTPENVMHSFAITSPPPYNLIRMVHLLTTCRATAAHTDGAPWQ